jgi:DNA-binding GntR family transcriptional regulator
VPGPSNVLEEWDVAPLGRVAAPLREQVITAMRNAILEFQLRPGQRLIERELIDRFGVSRTTIREALRDLASEGLVTVVPQKGAIVSAPSAEEAADIYDVRAHLESMAVERFVARATDDQVAALRRTVDTLAEVSRNVPANTLAVLRAKDDFYETLIDGAGSDVLRQLLNGLQARVRVLRATSLGADGRAVEAADEMCALMTAVERRDGQRAAALCVEHVRNASASAQRKLAETPPG